jgi:hypothetical protein
MVTHTFAELPVSSAAFDETKNLLECNCYPQAVMPWGDKGEILDMQGLALVKENEITAKLRREELAERIYKAICVEIEKAGPKVEETWEQIKTATGEPMTDWPFRRALVYAIADEALKPCLIHTPMDSSESL